MLMHPTPKEYPSADEIDDEIRLKKEREQIARKRMQPGHPEFEADMIKYQRIYFCYFSDYELEMYILPRKMIYNKNIPIFDRLTRKLRVGKKVPSFVYDVNDVQVYGERIHNNQSEKFLWYRAIGTYLQKRDQLEANILNLYTQRYDELRSIAAFLCCNRYRSSLMCAMLRVYSPLC